EAQGAAAQATSSSDQQMQVKKKDYSLGECTRPARATQLSRRSGGRPWMGN
ncbi:unnamed protein product, partial [Trichogramma brassicae]